MNNNPFYRCALHNRTDKVIALQMQPDQGPLPSQDPVLLPDGRYQIPVLQPTDEARHAALGKFMDEWSKLEMQLARLLSIALNSNSHDMPVLMNALGTKGQREALETLLVPKLKDAAAQKLLGLLSSVKTNATRRNHLVHGYWFLEIIVTDRNGIPWPSYRQYRRYDPTDAKIRKALEDRDDAKARKNYMFSVARISAISSELARLWQEFGAITARELKDAPKQPIEFSITDGSPITGFGA